MDYFYGALFIYLFIIIIWSLKAPDTHPLAPKSWFVKPYEIRFIFPTFVLFCFNFFWTIILMVKYNFSNQIHV